MKSSPWFIWSWIVFLGISMSVLEVGCKKDESNPVAPGPTGLPTFDFGASNQSFNVSGSSGPTRAKLTGGTLPYTITGEPSPQVASASLSHDTLTVLPIAAGSTSISIADSLGDRVVIIAINVTGSGGSLGSGTITTVSTAGNLSLVGSGLWPPIGGPSVLAVYDTVAREFVVLGYQQVSGPHFNFILVGANMPTSVTAGSYTIDGTVTGFQLGFNADTTAGSNSAYGSVSGSILVSSVIGAHVTGSYTGQAVLGSGQPTQFDGVFDVVYVRGISPIQIGR